MEEEKNKKRIWPVFLIVGIVMIISTILLIVVLTIVGIVVVANGFKSNYNTVTSYSYANTIANMNTTNKPSTVVSTNKGVNDYTFINDVLTENESQVETWIKNNYPGSSTQKTNYQSTNDSLWVVSSTSPMAPVSIGGVMINYDQVEFHLSDGYARQISFVKNGGTKNQFDSLYKSFAAIYGQKQVYVGEADVLTKLMDPTHEYLSYIWSGSEFDGYYTLLISRAVYDSQPKITVSISKDY